MNVVEEDSQQTIMQKCVIFVKINGLKIMKKTTKIIIYIYCLFAGLMLFSMIQLFCMGQFGWGILCMLLLFFWIESSVESISNSIARSKR